MNMPNKVVIGLPYVRGEEEMVELIIPLLKARAGIPVEIVTKLDENMIGWFKMHTQMIKEIDCEWYVLGLTDYFPGRQFIKMALERAISANKRYVGFNDGKWFGTNATSGIIKKELVPKIYGGPLFYPEYKSHGADPDLFARANILNEFVYCPEAVYMEIDYTKDLRKTTNPEDMGLYKARRDEGFPGIRNLQKQGAP